MKRTVDMTFGSPIKRIIFFAIPVLLGTLFQQLYNMTDTVIVGRFLGESALAAVGSTGSTVYLVIGFTAGITQGFSILISQAFGSHRTDALRKFFAHSLFLTLVISIALSVPSVLLCKSLLRIMNTPEEILSMSYSYLRIIFLGIPCTMLYNVCSSTLRAMGDSRTPLYFLIFSSFLNVGLDIFFIVVSGLGTAGVALATVISQFLSAALSFRYLFHSCTQLRLSKHDWKLEAETMRRMILSGIPMALNQSIIAAGIMIAQSGINTLGPSVIAAYAAASKVENLTSQPFLALSSGMSTFCSQNYGAHKFDRIFTGIRRIAVLSLLLGGVGILFYICAAKSIVLLFVSNPSPELLHYAELYLFTTAWFLPALAWVFLFRNALVGLGQGTVSMLGGILELTCRFLSIQFLLPVAGFWCIRLINPISWIAASILFISLYARWEHHQKERISANSLS